MLSQLVSGSMLMQTCQANTPCKPLSQATKAFSKLYSRNMPKPINAKSMLSKPSFPNLLCFPQGNSGKLNNKVPSGRIIYFPPRKASKCLSLCIKASIEFHLANSHAAEVRESQCHCKIKYIASIMLSSMSTSEAKGK